MNETEIERFVSLEHLAATLELSKAWLREAADHGLIPCLMVGKQRRFCPSQVTEQLKELATIDANVKLAENNP